MPSQTLVFLAEVNLALGLVDVNEYKERLSVAHWLSASDKFITDPREPSQHGQDEARQDQIFEALNEPEVRIVPTGDPASEDWFHLVLLNKWYFTRSDPDSYPSTPHGHLQNAERAWPKLNPYTGRVFKAKHQEDTSCRLTKHEMQTIWRAAAFRDFCRSHVLWYAEAHPHYAFRVRHALRFPRW